MELAEGLDRDEWTSITGGLAGLSLMQSWEYAEAKRHTGPWKPVRFLFRDGSAIVAAAQGIIRSIPLVGGGLLWINRGPLLSGGSSRYEDVLGLIRLWARRRRYYVRAAPPFSAGRLNEASLLRNGFRRTDVDGWCSSIVDLVASEDDLRKRLDAKWRNQLNKAAREGVTVEWSTSEDAFVRYVADYAAMLRRKQFETTVTPEFLTAFQVQLPDDRKTIVFTAMHDGKAVGMANIAPYGETAEYLSGTMTDAGRRLNAGNALLWSAISEMKSRGFRRFDVGGMHPQRTPKGIFDFKAGLGGHPYCLENEIETSATDWRSVLIRRRIAARKSE